MDGEQEVDDVAGCVQRGVNLPATLADVRPRDHRRADRHWSAIRKLPSCCLNSERGGGCDGLGLAVAVKLDQRLLEPEIPWLMALSHKSHYNPRCLRCLGISQRRGEEHAGADDGADVRLCAGPRPYGGLGVYKRERGH